MVGRCLCVPTGGGAGGIRRGRMCSPGTGMETRTEQGSRLGTSSDHQAGFGKRFRCFGKAGGFGG